MRSAVNRMRSFNSSRHRLWQENAAFAASIPAGALVLDAGAGHAPYRDLFAHTRYESADFKTIDKQYAPLTYVCDLRDIPVEDARFDYIIFNQVMEHLSEPLLTLRELYRVLQPGGKLIYSGPLFFEEHEIPYDFFRYTQYGLRHLFSAAGYTIDRIDWLEGYFGTVGYQLSGMARDLPWLPNDLRMGVAGMFLAPMLFLFKVACAAGSMAFHRLEVRSKYTKKGYPKNFVAILSKPGVRSL